MSDTEDAYESDYESNSNSNSDSDRARRNNEEDETIEMPDNGDTINFLMGWSHTNTPPALASVLEQTVREGDTIPCEICMQNVAFATYTEHIEICMMQSSRYSIERHIQRARPPANTSLRFRFSETHSLQDVAALEMLTQFMGMRISPSSANDYEYNLWVQERMGGNVPVGVPEVDRGRVTTRVTEAPLETVCTICLDVFSAEGEAEACGEAETDEGKTTVWRKTSCDHYFCESCIFKWLEVSRKCPNCSHILE